MTNDQNFADRLYEAIDKTQNPSVIGLDPRLESIPGFIKQENIDKHGKTFKAAASSFFDFNKEIMKELKGIVPAVKPQLAFYEEYGSVGIKAFKDTIDEAKRLGFIIIADGKRNDIGSTSKAYANAFLGKTDLFGTETPCFDVDSLTVNAYLGSDGILPFVESCKDFGKGIFALVKTSNPSSSEFQDLTLGDNKMYEIVASLVNDWGFECIGNRGYSSIGAVVGATHPKQAANIRKIIPRSFFLVPGFGAQGGTADDTIPCFNKDGFGAIVNSSRGVIFAYKNKNNNNRQDKSEESFAKIAAQAAIDMKQQLHSSLKKADIDPW